MMKMEYYLAVGLNNNNTIYSIINNNIIEKNIITNNKTWNIYHVSIYGIADNNFIKNNTLYNNLIRISLGSNSSYFYSEFNKNSISQNSLK
ncbi:hypothetical protein ALNOE001_11930 [Candidatus Methanobinarius endosymbioticus]|uniref:Uncharacterized protein n=1 Tax=Candidatus Methanobinarius endosymbioticus TaxID=2006182 RepID=A0A366MA32_9EURY|nr:hypothetical protein ALNOE001_11930 [Candidatus Methanobinarius endosymbioticus]